jgi:ABC-2 type transport system permease protein/lipopolysaccharide transport system permease protein
VDFDEQQRAGHHVFLLEMTTEGKESMAAIDGQPTPPVRANRVRMTPGRDLVDVWRHRELVRSLVERDLRVRYKQSWFGWAWALITPFVTIVLFTLLFKKVGHVQTGTAPYPLFAYLGLVPWGFFVGAFSTGSGALILNGAILNKVYYPREVFVVGSLLVVAFDTLVSLVGLGVLFAYYAYPPRATTFWLIPLIAVEVAFSAGMGLAFAVFVVHLRDVSAVISVIIQAGLFVTPVGWALSSIPRREQLLYCALDPLGAVIDDFRRAVLYGQAPRWRLLAAATVTSLLVLVGGYLIFRRLERNVADVI